MIGASKHKKITALKNIWPISGVNFDLIIGNASERRGFQFNIKEALLPPIDFRSDDVLFSLRPP